jgi:hypothetical protein
VFSPSFDPPTSPYQASLSNHFPSAARCFHDLLLQGLPFGPLRLSLKADPSKRLPHAKVRLGREKELYPEMYPHDVEEEQKNLMRMRTLFFFGIVTMTTN